MWNLEKIQMNVYAKQKQIHRYRNKRGYQRGEGRGGGTN